ncbi:glucosaminidase domain-containing protein [Clostridium sp. FP2]|uniref:glucosaminidase domain-containing protein n=1 Tax=Clostridium sp. FP2 TaxID=2724481 RepID=UPI0013E970F2|nr:glucosaminidase domain-containing protein [Clostridium sp. FP2]MBZ9626393.1 glucosaminidase domain-containing protein [Clostridium sp. FP2]
MNKTQIIKSLIPGALLSYEKYNILPSFTIAEAILETGWLQYVKSSPAELQLTTSEGDLDFY